MCIQCAYVSDFRFHFTNRSVWFRGRKVYVTAQRNANILSGVKKQSLQAHWKEVSSEEEEKSDAML